MDKIFFLFSFFSFFLVINAQNFKCKSVHIGKFQIDNGEYGITVIERNSKMQTETNTKMGYKARYDVTWIDDCHYELKNRKVIQGKILEGSTPDDVLRAEILKVINNKVFLKLSSNFSDEIMECEMVKIK